MLSAKGCEILLCKDPLRKGHTTTYKQHDAHIANKWFQYKWDTKDQKAKHCSVKGVHLNESGSYEAGNLFSEISLYRLVKL